MSTALSDLALGMDELMEVGGDEATITTSAGSRQLMALFEEPTSATVDGEPIELTGPQATIRSADLPTNASGATMRVVNRVFNITAIEPDSLGMTVLKLANA